MTRVLVIEDEALVRDNIGEILKSEGFMPLLAGDGEVGIEMARRERPDLILCDIRMPRMDGYTVLSVLTRDHATNTIPFIFITARTERTDHRTGMSLGADDYITKPFTRRELLNSVNKRLEKQQVIVRHVEEKYHQLQTSIARSLPANLLSPLSILIGSAELLSESETIFSDPAQVRGVARGIHKAAARLIHLINIYSLYVNLESSQKGSGQDERNLPEQLELRVEEIIELLYEVAHEFSRDEDLAVSLGSGIIKISESSFYTLLEELIDLAFRWSRPGQGVQILGEVRYNSYCLLITYRKADNPADRLLANQEDMPLGFLLVSRIVDIYGGNLEIHTQKEGMSVVEVNFPRGQ